MLTPSSLLLRLLHYGGVGAVGTAAHYVVLLLCVERVGLAVTVSTTLGFIVGAVVNYQLNARLTFRDHRKQPFAFGRFVLIAIVGAIINLAVVDALSRHAGLHYLLCQVVATLAVLLFGFLANSVWTFRRHDVEP